MLGENRKIIRGKILLKNFKEQPSKLEKGYTQDLVKQNVAGKLHLFSLTGSCENLNYLI